MKFDVTSKYILGIVGIVALVGIVVMILNSAGSSIDISGQAVAGIGNRTNSTRSCGDGACVPPENITNCPRDCTPRNVTNTTGYCGDGICNGRENSRTCPRDCRSAVPCNDTDGGFNFTTQGTVSGGVWLTTGAPFSSGIDYCNSDDGNLMEYFCYNSTTAYYNTIICEDKMGAGYACIDGVCVYSDADGDGVIDSEDVCAGYDDTVDTDGDGVPDSCDLPDLVLDESLTSVEFSPRYGSTVYIMSNGSVAWSNATANLTVGIENVGTNSTSLTYSYQRAMVGYEGYNFGAYMTSTYGLPSTFAEGSSTSFTGKVSMASSSYILPDALFNELYTTGSAEVDVNYQLDYYSYTSSSRKYGVDESNELNNNGTYSIDVSSSGITFYPADCRISADCSSGCGCTGSYCYVYGSDSASSRTAASCYSCYQYSSGASTYLTTTEC